MKIKKLSILLFISVFYIFSVTSLAQNRESRRYYKLDTIQTQHYINMSREEVSKHNLSLARLYAQKALESNVWSKRAWNNYNDIIKRLVKNGQIKDFAARLNNKSISITSSNNAPSAKDTNKVYMGC